MKTNATVQAPWQTVLERLVRTLREKGFQARRTFDLQLARQLLRSNETEPCPHHGTAPCSCQYLVLQISGPEEAFSAVVIHGHDQTTTISFLTGTGGELQQDMRTAAYEALEHLQNARDARRQTRGHKARDSSAYGYAASKVHESRRRETL